MDRRRRKLAGAARPMALFARRQGSPDISRAPSDDNFSPGMIRSTTCGCLAVACLEGRGLRWDGPKVVIWAIGRIEAFIWSGIS